MMKNGRFSLPRAISSLALIGSLSLAVALHAMASLPDRDRDDSRAGVPLARTSARGVDAAQLRITTSSNATAQLSIATLRALPEDALIRFEPPRNSAAQAVQLRLRRTQQLGIDRFAWSFYGERDHDFALLVARNDVIAGAVHTGGATWWRLISRSDDTVSVEEIAEDELPSCGGALAGAEIEPANGGLAGAGEVCSGECSETTIGLGIFYTLNAATGAGGLFEVEALCELGVALANEGFYNSELSTRARINHLGPIDYDDSTETNHLGHFSNGGDGHMDEVQPIMDVTGSDVAILVVEYGEGYCGVAYGGPSRYHVDVRGCMGSFVLAHELGHNLGGCHACGDGGGCNCGGYFDYSVGWRWYGDSGQQWRTILAYGPGNRIPNYSNPRIEHDGHPTGIPVGDSGEADNARTFELTTPIVSAFACPPAFLQTVKLLPSDAAQLDVFGKAAAISDGRVIIGAYLSEGLANDSGATYVFTLTGEGEASCPPDPYGFPSESCYIESAQPPTYGTRPSDGLGRALDADSDWLAAGAYLADIVSTDEDGNEVVDVAECGSVFLYERADEAWCLKQTLFSDAPMADDRFGSAVAMDGDTMVVGAPRVDIDDDELGGAAEVFTRSGDTWTHDVTFRGGSLGNSAQFGSSVALDGDNMAITAPYAFNDKGSVRTYRNVDGAWTFLHEVDSPAASDTARFGSAVAISDDWMLIGAPNADTEDGRVYMYRFTGSEWKLAQTFTPLGGENDGRFGTSVAIDDVYAIVGAPRSPGLGVTDTGAAFMWKRVSTTWYLIAIITAFDAEEGDQYGLSVAVENEVLVVGAGYDNDNGIQSGSAYVHPFGPLVDCNDNGYADDLEILQGIAIDNNMNGIPDQCDCVADMDLDQIVDGYDLNIFLDAWGSSGSNLRPDINLDGHVDGADLNILLGFWGACPDV